MNGSSRCWYLTRRRYGAFRGDSSRGASRDPKFLKWLHDNFVKALPYLESASVVLRADDRTPEELAALMVDTLPAEARGAHTA